MPKLTIQAGNVTLSATLNDTPTASALWQALPIAGRANVWGDEIYFSIPLEAELEADAQALVDVGTIAYWPPGNAFCLFWGPTPASTDQRPRAASPVNVLGQIDGDARTLADVPNGATVHLRRGESGGSR